MYRIPDNGLIPAVLVEDLLDVRIFVFCYIECEECEML
jgi:hypothetical protein